MSHVVVVGRRARRDIEAIAAWISAEADEAVADAYIDRVETRIISLGEYPKRGVAQPRFGDGIRSLSFERRLLIIYRVKADRVRVLRVLSATADMAALRL